jgi:hypothetical protein
MARGRIGDSVGKNPGKNLSIELDQSKYSTGGSKMRKKKGGIVRKPKATISYKRGK